MGEQQEKKLIKRICTGLLAHVDAGKTTLSESLLYTAGSIRKLGKVDTKDAFLDTNALERARGITIFSKQARFTWKDTRVTLLDTPGHVDFSAEMERVLGVLDYAVLLISASDGVQGHTQTLWELLMQYDVPVFLFINKMDQPGTDREKILSELKIRLDSGCVDFTDVTSESCQEDIAACEEETMEQYFETGEVTEGQIRRLIWERKLFPCFFGSALRVTGVEEFLDAIDRYTLEKRYPEQFGARVFKISRDPKGERLTHLKITGGVLKTKALLTNLRTGAKKTEDTWEEKINQIRLYNSEKYETPQEAEAGEVCTVTGLTKTYPGQGLGYESEAGEPLLEPVLSRQLILPEGTDPGVMLPKLRELGEELPELHIVWDERLQEIQVQVMGQVQIEVLSSLIAERFGVEVTFGPTHIVYRETIAAPVEGVGHFEPLRHYAEVHLLLEPLPAGSGLKFAADCSEDILDKNWQRLILTHLGEKTHRGVLTGSAITDMRITVIAGRAHQKHTEGGDFRKATYRAVRQGLMEADSILLEPYYNFRLELPTEALGRAMTDIGAMNGHFDAPVTEGEHSVLIGYAPVVTMQDYKQEVSAYTRGFGRLSFTLRGYEPCHNAEEVIAASGYDPEADPFHTADSVFCAHGSGYIVPWYEVKQNMHVESPLTAKSAEEKLQEAADRERSRRSVSERWLGVEEVDAIIEGVSGANRRNKSLPRRGAVRRRRREYVDPVAKSFGAGKQKRPPVPQEEYLLVDGYNIIYAWEELNALARENLDAARGRLMDELCNYQGYKKMQLIVVFDAYRVAGHPTEIFDYHNIHVVFTKEAETADQYIEKFAHTHASKYRVTVATSDGLEQVIIRGAGCGLLSAQDLRAEMAAAGNQIRENWLGQETGGRNRDMEKALEAVREAVGDDGQNPVFLAEQEPKGRKKE